MWAHTSSFWQASIEGLLCARLCIVQGTEIYKNKMTTSHFFRENRYKIISVPYDILSNEYFYTYDIEPK